MYEKPPDLSKNRKYESMIAHNSEELLKICLHSLKNTKEKLAKRSKA